MRRIARLPKLPGLSIPPGTNHLGSEVPKPLVIVESPAKARTISKFLGSGFHVEASIGHVRDLPASADDIPKSHRGKPWARTAVDVQNDFKPLYVLTQRGREQIKKLKTMLRDASVLYLATDEDREGEAIAWHLTEALKPKVPIQRLVFHEITKSAITRSLQSARPIDMNLVEAQEARRIVDRLFGYNVSPVLWKKVKPRLSAGRVQSVAVRLVVERERERMRFVSSGWWDLTAGFKAAEAFAGTLVEVDGTRLATGRDFEPTTGKLKTAKAIVLDEAGAEALATALRGGTAKVLRVQRRPFREKPAAPFTTSKLQQEANRKFRWAAKRTMSVAQRLYENGWITYMRTDSTTLSPEALNAARTLIKSAYGAAFLPAKPRVYATKSKGAQEAHEAIRPAGESFKSVDDCARALGADEARLYGLIWNRTVASQMTDATGERVSVDTEANRQGRTGLFRTRGKTYDFQGFRAVYVRERNVRDEENELPKLADGQVVSVESVHTKGHTTSPPSRLNEASLVQRLEELGIGRPSTYASIIETIQSRGYVFKKGTALIPTFTAFATTRLLEDHFNSLVDYDFTATLESGLDQIAAGTGQRLALLHAFYGGQGDRTGLLQLIAAAEKSADPRDICSIPIGTHDDGAVVARVGRYGPYLEHAGTTRSLPEDMPPDELTLAKAIEIIETVPDGPTALGQDPDNGDEITLHIGRFGPYVQRGEAVGKVKPKRESLLPGMEPDAVGLAMALQLLALPREVGKDADGNVIQAFNGRYGPYIKCNGESRSIPAEKGLLTLTEAEALALLATKPRRSRTPTVLKELGVENDKKIQVKSGRWGPYVTDGETNATLKKGTDPETLTLEEASTLLAAKRAKGPAKKRTRRKSTTKKKTTRRSTKSS